MSTKQKVLLLGANGETGSSILEALLASGQFEVEILVRPSSAEKPDIQKIKDRGVNLRVSDLDVPEEELASILSGFDTVISAIGPAGLLQQKTLVRAAKTAGVKRFVPCAFITVAPPTGVMTLRDEKEEIYNEIKRLGVPFTVIDVGYWHQISIPPVPSGRLDYILLSPDRTIHGDGDAPNLLTDLRDVGRFVARIITDDRTLNKYVYTWSDVLSENEIFSLVERVSGEKIDRVYESAQEVEKRLENATAEYTADPQDPRKRTWVYITQYQYSKYIRRDNSPAYAKYLGYLDARELYPDFEPVSFESYVSEALAGKGKLPYASKLPAL